MRRLAKEDLSVFLERLADSFQVVVPLQRGAEVEFGDLDPVSLAAGYSGLTRFSPKECLFPESETLLTFDVPRSDESPTIEEHRRLERTVIWGVRPCDLAGVRVLDAVFLSPPTDPYYEARRAGTLLFCLNCNDVGRSCFCHSLGTGPFAQGGYDLGFTDLGDEFLVEPGSVEGSELLKSHADVFRHSDDDGSTEKDALQSRAIEAFQTTLDTAGLMERLMEAIDDSIWEEQSRKCTLCGTCCIVCPACHCFNVEDLRKSRKTFMRVRYWDSCQFSGFTRMASTNSRPAQSERWRHKVFDKFVYMPSRWDGLLGCTGCGRCLDLCQGSINIVEVLKKVGT